MLILLTTDRQPPSTESLRIAGKSRWPQYTRQRTMKYTYVSQKVSAREKTAYKNKSNWQPWTLSAPFLQLFLCICILFAVFIEILLRASEGHQGFILSDPTASSFVFNYLPTIIAVVFSLLWATVAHDYLRLEPYFQLSKPEGVTAKHSLLLDYSYAFPHLILWTAFKRRYFNSALLISTIFCGFNTK